MAETPVVTSTPAAASTPAIASSTPASSSTADIATSVIADIEGGGNGSAPATPVVAKPAPGEAAVAKVTPEVDPDDFDAIPAEVVDSLGRKRVNSIPHTRVGSMITKREQKLLTDVAKELGLTPAQGAALKLEDIVGTIKEHGTKRTNYEARLKQVDIVEALIAKDPDKFMEIIAGINPAYKEFARKQAAATAAATTPVVDLDPEPQPDYDLGNGQTTYTLDGLKKRDAWKERQLEKKFDKMLADRFKPVDDRFKADKDREEEQSRLNERTKSINERVARARKWPQFTENEQPMLDAMKAAQAAGQPISFEEAYMQVVVPKLAGDRTKIRTEVLAEIEAQPKTSSVAASPAVVKPAETGKPKTTAEIAREVMASMGE